MIHIKLNVQLTVGYLPVFLVLFAGPSHDGCII